MSCCDDYQAAQSSRRSGFMLLTVVIMLAIVCLVFYRLASISLGYIQQINAREVALRERWTLITLRRSLLQQSPGVLSRREQSANLANVSGITSANLASSFSKASYYNQVDDEVQINNLVVAIQARDENARLFLPGLLPLKPRAEVRTIIDRLQGSRGLTVKNLNEFDHRPVPETWRDIFASAADNTSSLTKATQRMTLWGSGRLNIYRADDTTIEEAWRVLFGHFPPRELMEARMRYPPLAWQQLREQLDLRDNQIALANAWFHSGSDCFSVRLSLQSKAGLRDLSKRYYFVSDRNGDHYGFEE